MHKIFCHYCIFVVYLFCSYVSANLLSIHFLSYSAIPITVVLTFGTNFGFLNRYWFCCTQKQPPEVFLGKGVLRNFAKFTGKHLYQSLFFRLWHRYFPLNFAKFLRTPFPKNTSERLLLCFCAQILAPLLLLTFQLVFRSSGYCDLITPYFLYNIPIIFR